jgi:membrane protease YdiL (CAAX protease family)
LSYGDNPLPPHPEIQGTPSEPPLDVLSPPVAEAPAVDHLPWGIWDLVRIAVVAVIAILLFSIVAMAVAIRSAGPAHVAAADLARDPRIVIPAQLAAYLVVIVYMVSLVRSRGRPFWTAVRWNWPGRTWFAWMTLGVALAVIVQSASALLPIPKSLPIEKYFRDPLGAWMMTGFGLTLAPLVEELFFRGFMYPALARRLGAAMGVVITAALFAFIHTSQLAHAWAPLLLLLTVGVVLTTVRARTNSVATTFLIHVGYNATLFTMLYIASDRFRHLERVT